MKRAKACQFCSFLCQLLAFWESVMDCVSVYQWAGTGKLREHNPPVCLWEKLMSFLGGIIRWSKWSTMISVIQEKLPKTEMDSKNLWKMLPMEWQEMWHTFYHQLIEYCAMTIVSATYSMPLTLVGGFVIQVPVRSWLVFYAKANWRWTVESQWQLAQLFRGYLG